MNATEVWETLKELDTGTALDDAPSVDKFWNEHGFMAGDSAADINCYFQDMHSASDQARPKLFKLLRLMKQVHTATESELTERTKPSTRTPQSNSVGRPGREPAATDDDDDNDSTLDVTFGESSAASKPVAASAKKTVVQTAAPTVAIEFYDDGKYIRLTVGAVKVLRGIDKPEQAFVSALNASPLFVVNVNGAAAIALRTVGLASSYASSDSYDLLRLRIAGTLTRSFDLLIAGESGKSDVFTVKTLVAVVNERHVAMKRATNAQLPRSFVNAPAFADAQQIIAFMVDKGDLKLVREPGRAGRRLAVQRGSEAALKAVLSNVAQAAFGGLPSDTQWKLCASTIPRKAAPALDVCDFNSPPLATVAAIDALFGGGCLPPTAAMPQLVMNEESGDRSLMAASDAQCSHGDAQIGLALSAPFIESGLGLVPLWNRVLLTDSAAVKHRDLCIAGIVVDQAIVERFANTDANAIYLTKFLKRKLNFNATPPSSTATASTTTNKAGDEELSSPEAREAPAKKPAMSDEADGDDEPRRLTDNQRLKLKIDRYTAAAMLLVKASGFNNASILVGNPHANGTCSVLCAVLSASQFVTDTQLAEAFEFTTFDELNELNLDQMSKHFRQVLDRRYREASRKKKPLNDAVHQNVRQCVQPHDKTECGRIRDTADYLDSSLAMRLVAAAVVDVFVQGSTATYAIGIRIGRWPDLKPMMQLLKRATLSKQELVDALQPGAFWCCKDGMVHDDGGPRVETETRDALLATLDMLAPAFAAVACNNRVIVTMTAAEDDGYQHTWGFFNKNADARLKDKLLLKLPALGKVVDYKE